MSSLSASVENISGHDSGNAVDNSSANNMCMELALEGERLCKAGDCRAGVAFFQAAIQAGTDDLRTLSAIYSQLGNAYFYLSEFTKAMQYHKHDLTLAISMNDKLGEAKSSGNLGNTLKVMGRFDEAAICCERHLTLARQLGDKLSEGRALYNLGNVYHAKGKSLGQKSPGEASDDVRDALAKAVEFYQQNLKMMRELGDRGAQGRACGNLGNTYYLLGNFQAAIEHHQERLRIAREFGDRSAERRANSNLGNSHIFLGQFEEAAEHYKRTLALAVELGEREVEAQACYSLGNTYTLLREFDTAIEYHHRHLRIAQELGDRVGEARACWSLGNAHSSNSNHKQALKYAELHYELARALNDTSGANTARVNISDLCKLLGQPEPADLGTDSESNEQSNTAELLTADHTAESADNAKNRKIRVRRQSMEQLDLLKLTPDGKRLSDDKHNHNQNVQAEATNKPQDDDFFELLSRTQSKRMDDQRCSIKLGKPAGAPVATARKPLTQQNSILNEASKLPGLRPSDASTCNMANAQSVRSAQQPDDAFLDMLMRCQGSRLEEQRSELPRLNATLDAEEPRPEVTQGNAVDNEAAQRNGGSVTVPDEDFLSLIIRVQRGRMEDQRAAIPRRPRNQLN